MIRYCLRHLSYLALLILAVTALTFFLLRLAPGDFLSELSLNPQIPRELVETLRHQYGLDKPWYVQYWRWLSQSLRGEFGYSLLYHRPVFALIWERAGNTLLLALPTFAVGLATAIVLSLISAWRRRRWPDRVISFLATAGLSLPTLVVSLVLLYVAARTGWFPIGDIHSSGFDELTLLGKLRDGLWHIMLPMMALGLRVCAMFLRYLRASLFDVLSEPFVVTAYAKGLTTAQVLLKHALPNAINPVLSVSGLVLANLLSGSFIVEIVMSWPGLGRLTLDAFMSRDVYLVMAGLITSSGLLLIGNALADLALAWHDPRIRLQVNART
ncbi:MAG: ABC transporter permease [Acidobacteria bacterium]|nr:ABC transporter permease [Acidobacteriota bacterium]MBI3657165.1 ABC transporter permease [Acidobacteriota bacterium]